MTTQKPYLGETAWATRVYYEHTYLVSGFEAPGVFVKKRHYCLNLGDFCFKNLIEHPLDIINYFKIKLKRL